MNLTKTFGLAFMATALLFTSCKKDDKDEPKAVTCKLAKSVYFNTQSGARVDSASYTYTNDKITKATAPDYYYSFEYSGDRISKRSYYETGQTAAVFYQQISYNSDGTISKVESYEPTTGTNYAITDRMEFVYSSGKIQKVDYLAVSGTNSQKLGEFQYTYTGNNVTQVKIVDATNGQSVTYTYTYDTNNNFMKKQNAQIHLIDPFFGDVDPTSMPFAISANNVASLSSSTGSTPLTYNLDDKQNLKGINVAGKAFVEYGYQCQ